MGEEWIKIEVSFPQHRKTVKLAKLLGISRQTAAGIVVDLLCFTLAKAWRTADLSPWGDEGIAEVLGWKGDPAELVKALQRCGSIEDEPGFLVGYEVHNFFTHAGMLAKDRMRKEKERHGEPMDLVPKEGRRRKAQRDGEVLQPEDANLILAAWNIFAESNGLVVESSLPGRIPEGLTAEAFVEVLKTAEGQDFLFGKSEGSDGWKMDMGWLLKAENRNKVLRRVYGRKEKAPPGSGPTVDDLRKKTADILAGRK